MTTDERLERLERALGRSRRFNLWLLAAMGLAAGAWLLAGAFHGEQAWAQTTKPENDSSGVIRAKGFVVEDENGKTRAMLDMNKDVPRLRLFDEKGKPLVSLDASKDGAGLFLADENGKLRAGLIANKDGPMLKLADQNGTLRVLLDASKGRPGLSLADKNGKTRAELGVSGTESRDGTIVQHPEFTLTLFDPEGKVIWQSPR